MIKYRPGDQLHIADTLSRASQTESTSQADEFEVHLLLGISKKIRLMSLKERQTLTQCYEKPVKEVILTTAIGSIKTTSLQFISQNFMI